MLDIWKAQHLADRFVELDLADVNRPNLELWLTDLETTNDPQTTNRLTDSGGDCCLGRQCKVSIAAGVPVVVHVYDDGAVEYGDEMATPPSSVRVWLGITNSDFYDKCADLNDQDKLTFAEIAQVLRAVFA